MTGTPFFWNRIAKRYASQPVADEAAYQKKLDYTQRYFTPESLVLEFGCGTGSTAIYHAPKVKHILATDISLAMLEIARDKAKAAALENITFAQSTLMAIESPEEHWDVVLGMSILHLLPDKDAHIRRVYELLKPGGVFVSSTACIKDMPTWFKFLAPVFTWTPLLPSVQVFGAEALKQSFIKAGFEIDYEWQPGPDKAVFLVARKPS
jgi:ubiquinone/menaquinone biosynthesis C-methylase UbiE